MNSFVVTTNGKKTGSYEDLSKAQRAIVKELSDVEEYVDLTVGENNVTLVTAAALELEDGTTFKIEVK